MVIGGENAFCGAGMSGSPLASSEDNLQPRQSSPRERQNAPL